MSALCSGGTSRHGGGSEIDGEARCDSMILNESGARPASQDAAVNETGEPGDDRLPDRVMPAGKDRPENKTGPAVEAGNGRKGRNRRTVTALVTAGLFVLLAFAAFYSGLVVRRYRTGTDKLEPGRNVRIVLITDLHSCIYGENQERLLGLIKKQEPDIIALAGDIADDKAPLTGTKMFLAGISDIAPVFYVSGNHECWSYRLDKIKEMIRGYGVTVLEHNWTTVTVDGARLIICGVDDPDIKLINDIGYDWEQEMHRAFDGLADEPGYKILLSHRPELVDIYREFSFDLVLSGHSHGGQVRIPLILNGLYAPDQGWFPKYAGGIYRHGSMTHVVSRGVSYNPRLPRVFNPPEVVVIDINGEDPVQH